MKIWLLQYYTDSYDRITEIGCFEWKIKIDKRNPTKPKKIPLVKESHKLKSSSFSRRKSKYAFRLSNYWICIIWARCHLPVQLEWHRIHKTTQKNIFNN